jgi:transglycosylase-like protein with SLT domain
VRRWRSPFSSLTILGMLFWLGTAMAPSVSSDAVVPPTKAKTVKTAAVLAASANPVAPDNGPLLPWPSSYCPGECPEPPPEPSLETDDWRPEVPVTTTTVTAPPTVQAEPPRALSPAPAPAPRPVEEWRSLVSAYFAPEDVDLALRVISCESGGDPNAQNRSSGAAGLFQQIPRYWEARAASAGMPGASIFDPIANVAASAYLAYTEGWGHWAASAGCWG